MKQTLKLVLIILSIAVLSIGVTACSSGTGSSSKAGGATATGTDGVAGTPGTDGTDGTAGTPGTDGADGTDGTAGVAGTPGTDGSTGSTGATGTDNACDPVCQPGWECGPDGCGGQCGTCPSGKKCNVAKHVCEESTTPVGDALFGESCGQKGSCQPTIVDAEGKSVDNPQWPACINAQCETNFCMQASPLPLLPVCGKPCQITQDTKDHQGASGADNIDDADAPFNDCAGAKDGPYGTNWTCVNQASPDQNPFTVCVPGTTLAPCKTSAECPDNESCQLMLLGGQFSLRCMGQPKAGNKGSGTCNYNPEEGEIELCKENLCFGLGCVNFCGKDADCATNTDGCDAGKCKKNPAVTCQTDDDCSSWFCFNGDEAATCTNNKCSHNANITCFDDTDCKIGKNIGSSENPLANDTCWPKSCGTNVDCADTDFYCGINNNGQFNSKFDWNHLCLRAKEGAAALGEECETDPEDNIALPACGAGTCLNSGTCSAICAVDDDCKNDNVNMLCSAYEVPVDFEGDDKDDMIAPMLGLCVPYPGSQKDCNSNKDCDDTETCKYFEYYTAGKYDAKGLCTTTEAGMGDIGDLCGGPTGVTCKSGFCIGSSDTESGFCTGVCNGKDTCPQGVMIGQTEYNFYCRTWLGGYGGTIDEVTDNVWLPLCWPTSKQYSSLTDCSADTASCPENQACVGWASAMGATGAQKLELLCMGAYTMGADNQPVFNTGTLGQKCDTTGEAANGVYCKSNYCLSDIKEGEGYCSDHCKTDADCSAGGAEMVCDKYTLIDKPEEANDLSINICRKKKTCMPCNTDTDCAGDYVCINAGGQGLLANRRCAPPCQTNDQCAGTDGGSQCKDSLDEKGAPEGKKACIKGC